MKKLVVSLTAALFLCLSLIGTALANEKNLKKTLTLREDVRINNTVIKKGEYRVVFNAKTEEVTLSRDGDVVYSGKASVELRPEKARYNSAVFKETDKGKRLDGFTFAGDKRAILLAETANSTADGGQ
ncbi:MAG: hypothetical protein U0Y68_24955 [Blastocatellia bacterium]